MIKGLTLIFVELPKCLIKTYEEKKLRVLWLRFLRELGENTLEVDPELLQVPEIQQTIKYSEQTAYSPKELDAYESYWKAISNEKTLREASRQEGRIEGKIEIKLEIAQTMKAKGYSLEEIKPKLNFRVLSDPQLYH